MKKFAPTFFSVFVAFTMALGLLGQVTKSVEAATYFENFDTDAYWSCGGLCTAYANVKTYSDPAHPEVTFEVSEGLRNTNAIQDGFTGTHSGSYSWRVRDTAYSYWQARITSGGVGTFSFWVRRWDASPDPSFSVEYSIDNANNWTNILVINNALLGSSNWSQINGTINTSNGAGSADDILIRVRRQNTGERIMIDDFQMTDFAADSAPTVISTSPSNGATNVAYASNVTVTFSEPVNVTSNWAWLLCTASGNLSFSYSGGPTTFTIDPTIDFLPEETCTLTVYATEVTDQDSNDPPDNMAANFTSSFVTAAPLDIAPTVSSTSPANGATNVAINSDVVVNFSEPVSISSGGVNVTCSVSGSHNVSAVMSNGDQTITLNPAVDFNYSETCTITVTASSVSDTDTNDPPDTMAEDGTYTFTTMADPCAAPYTAIHTIQGNSAASPIVNTTITTQGVVTGYLSTFGGFYIQDQAANYDADPLTSEGIFVYSTAYPVSVGDYVRVSGKVTEYQTVTEVGTITNVTKCQSVTPITPTLLSLPLPAGATLEPYEGMYVQFENPFVVAQNYFLGRYGQMHISTRRFFNPTNGQGDTTDEFLRSSIVLDDGKSAQNPSPTPYIGADNTVRAGDTLSAGLTGYIDQGAINSTPGIYGYRLQPVLSSVQITRTNQRPSPPSFSGSTIKVVGFNVENYFVTIDRSPYPAGSPYYYNSSSDNNTPRGADSDTEFTRQRNKLFAGLAALNPDVFGVTELEAWTGAASQANFIAGLNATPGVTGTYAFIPDPSTGYGSDAIKNGIFYKVGSVTPVGPSMSSTDPIYKRAPIAQTFVDNNGAVFSVIVNHFKSKGSCPSDPADPESEHGQGCWNVTRVAEANALLAFIEQVKSSSGDPDVLVIGDLNSYGVEDPINTLTNGGLINEMSFVSPADRYSYIFDGYSGYLDHGLSSASMHIQVMGIQPWHINSDEPSIIDYNTEFKGSGSYPPDLYASNAYRASDHDPIVIGLNLDGSAPYALVTNPSNGTILENLKINELIAVFSEDVVHDGGVDAADNPDNYILVERGTNKVFDTLTCDEGVQTDDKEIVINNVTYDPVTYSAVLSVNDGDFLPEGDYRLFVCGTTSIHDLFGNVLNNGEFDTISDFGIRLPIDAVAATSLPATGFAPDRVTDLPAQTVSYASLGDLWLEIPSLNVKTPIVGVPQSGSSWDVTWLGSQAGWLEGSAYPTALGNSVLTAHVWDALNKPGAFYALDKLGYGDKIIVHSFGTTYTYEVRRVMTVAPSNVEAMLKHQEDAWLTLVTCKGFVASSDQYAYRTLVRAELVSVK